METIVIDRKGCRLTCQQGRLMLHIGGQIKPYSSLPLAPIKFVLVVCDCSFGSSLLRQLAKARVTLMVIDPKDSQTRMICYNDLQPNSFRRLSQYQLCHDPNAQHRLAKLLIKRKIRSHQHQLQTLMQRQPNEALAAGIVNLQRYRRTINHIDVPQRQNRINALMVLEAQAAKDYFQSYFSAFANYWQVSGRNRRPPQDPVNALLSLTYTIGYSLAVRACLEAGLDPSIGAHHRPCYSRDSLACDLVELIRASINQWVWAQCQQKQFATEHFAVIGGGCTLTKAGRQVFYPRLYSQLPNWQAQLNQAAQLLARYIDRNHKLATE